VALWPVLKHVMGVVSPALNSEANEGSSSWDLRTM